MENKSLDSIIKSRYKKLQQTKRAKVLVDLIHKNIRNMCCKKAMLDAKALYSMDPVKYQKYKSLINLLEDVLAI